MSVKAETWQGCEGAVGLISCRYLAGAYTRQHRELAFTAAETTSRRGSDS